MKNAPIAVFDSGLGGISVLRALLRQLPREEFLYYGDCANAPYGTKPTESIRALTLQCAGQLLDGGAKALVVACNTATAAAISQLRLRYPDRIIVGMEPALKPAVDAFPQGPVLVMATEATLREDKFAALTAKYGAEGQIVKCPCPGLVEFVERGELEGEALLSRLRQLLGPHLQPLPRAIVLGCTHYPFLKAAIRQVVGDGPQFFDGADGTAKECKRRLEEAQLLRREGQGRVVLRSSLPSGMLPAPGRRLLELQE